MEPSEPREPSRLQVLAQLVERDPNGAFARYGLAMEYARLGDREKALEHFRKLLESNPDYAPSYYQAGQLLSQMGETEQARQVLQRGIEVTARLGDPHARSELEAALAEL